MARRAKKRLSKTTSPKTAASNSRPHNSTRRTAGVSPRATAVSQALRRVFDWAVRLKRLRTTRFILLWAISYAVLLSFFMRDILKSNNYIEIFPNELLFPLAMHAVTALIVSLAMFWLPWLKNFFMKMAAVVVLSMSLVGYDGNLLSVADAVRAIIPGMTAADGLSAVSVVYLLLLSSIASLIAVGLQKLVTRLERVKLKDAEWGVVVIVAWLFIVPALSLVHIIPAMIRETSTQAPEFTKPSGKDAVAAPADKPDIYYIVLDRYTNADTLKQQFNYDNTPFTGFLRANGFAVNDNAHSNYPYTAISISSTMTADYTNTYVAPFKDSAVQDHTLYHNLVWQSPVVKALKNEGYKYYALGSNYGLSYKAPLADKDFIADYQLTLFGKQKRLRGIEADEFVSSIYYRFAELPKTWWRPLSVEESSRTEDVGKQLQILNDLSTTGKPGGRFIFAHILVPHDPFTFRADGSLSLYPAPDNTGRPIKQKYVDQISFINDQMEQIVTNIQKQTNGKAVILFNADEGAYPQVLNSTFSTPAVQDGEMSEEGSFSEDNMTTWSDNWLQMKFGILQAAYIPNATASDLSNLSSVNLFRIILNRYAGYSLSYLPECHYGLLSGSNKEYQYADITGRFVANPDKRCTAMQSLPKTSR